MNVVHTFSGRLSLYVISLTGSVLIGTFAVFFVYSLRITEQNAVRNADNMLATASARIDAVLQSWKEMRAGKTAFSPFPAFPTYFL